MSDYESMLGALHRCVDALAKEADNLRSCGFYASAKPLYEDLKQLNDVLETIHRMQGLDK